MRIRGGRSVTQGPAVAPAGAGDIKAGEALGATATLDGLASGALDAAGSASTGAGDGGVAVRGDGAHAAAALMRTAARNRLRAGAGIGMAAE